VDIEGEPTAEEPHAFSAERVRRLFRPLHLEHERTIDEPDGHKGRQLVIVATKDAEAGSPSTTLPRWISPS
jgi:hypothetical protein